MKKDQETNPYQGDDVGVTVTTEGAEITLHADTENDVEVDIVITSGEVRIEMRKCWDGQGWVDC